MGKNNKLPFLDTLVTRKEEDFSTNRCLSELDLTGLKKI